MCYYAILIVIFIIIVSYTYIILKLYIYIYISFLLDLKLLKSPPSIHEKVGFFLFSSKKYQKYLVNQNKNEKKVQNMNGKKVV